MTGIELVTEEVLRNLNNGHTPEKDLENYNEGNATENDLIMAAISYATPENQRIYEYPTAGSLFLNRFRNNWPNTWPWMAEFWKPAPKDRVKELTKAAALLIHEIDRLKLQEKQS